MVTVLRRTDGVKQKRCAITADSSRNPSCSADRSVQIVKPYRRGGQAVCGEIRKEINGKETMKRKRGMKEMLQETYTLSNGTTIPGLGLGTWFIDDDKAAEAVRAAVKLGYRLIDTAQAYGNEVICCEV